MKPQEDFNKWSDNFKSELENEKKFSAFYPDCIELINQYITNGSLSPPINKKSDTFINKSIPTFVKLILRFKSLSKEIIDATINFLSKVLSLMTYRVVKGNLSDGKFITDILKSELDLYNRPKLDQFKRLCKLFIENGDYDKLLERTASDNPDFQHLLLIYHIRKSINPYVDIPISKILPVIYKFITYFKDDVSLRTIDTSKFSKIINKEILEEITEDDQTDYTDLFNLAQYLIKTEIFDKQLLGVDILVTYNEKVGKSKSDTLSKWIQTTDLLNYLSKSDLHVEIIKRIQPIIKYCSKKHLISIKMIESLLERAEVIHKSEREPMCCLIITAFKGYETKDIIDFLQSHETDNLFLSILMENSKDLEIRNYCITSLLKRESKTDLLSRLNKHIRIVIIEYINQNFKTQNLNYLQEILPELIDTSKDAVKEFEEHINLIIRDYGAIPDKQEFVLLISKSYFKKARVATKITIGITTQLFKCPTDNLWTFYNDLLKDIGYEILDSGSFQFIDKYFQEYDYSNVDSEKFLNFMNTYSYKSMEFHHNENNPNDNDIDENFDFLIFPQSFLPILLKVYFTYKGKEDSPIYDLIQNNLLSFFNRIEDDSNETVSKAINDTLVPYLDPNNKKNSSLEMEKILSLLIKLINKSEEGIYLEDFGKQRHKEEIMFYPEMTLDFKSLKVTIHQDPEVPASTLFKRIKTFTTGVTSYNNYYKLKIYWHSTEVEKNRLISSFDPREFTVKNFGRRLNKQMISIVLHDKYNLTKKLIDLFNNQSIDKKILDLAWELVQLLPSLKDVKVDLHSCKSEYLLRYALDLICLDKSFNNYDLLAELLISRKLKHSDIFLMTVILRVFNDEFVQYFPKMCKIILEQFKENNTLTVPAKLLQLLAKKYKGSDKILLQYNDDIVTMLFSVTKDTIQPIIRTVDPISPLKTIFDKSIDKLKSIGELENKDWIVKGLFSLYQSHVKDVNSKKLIEATMKIADQISCGTLIQVIDQILKINPDEKNNMKKYVFDNLLNRIYDEDNRDEFNSFLKLKNYYNDIDDSLEKLLANPNTKCKAFNIKQPSTEEDENLNNDNEFRGIVNLGVTCFMNSTLQQLFFTFPFRYLVLTTEKDSLLYNIFSELICPKKESVSMKKYIPDVDKIIDTHSQQDAYEFYQLLIDKQNEKCQNIFKGKYINHIEGINNDYSSTNEEDFTGIDLTVLDKKDLHESFEALCETEVFQMSENKDVRKYQRILKAPQALVIQLKRFEYNYDTFKRYKINSRYEFPQTFDIAPYMDDKNIGSKIYELFGVVIHSGRANSGHYYSLIRLNEKWYEFNDNYVHEFPKDKFDKVVYGSKQTEKNGYLLFYHEKDAVFSDGKFNIRYDQVPDQELSNEILNDLNKEKLHYCLFSESFMQFASESTLPFQIYYFFKVFLHSTMDEEQSKEFIIKLSHNLNSNDPIKSFTKVAVDEIDSFTGMLIKCKSDDVRNSSISIVSGICENKHSFDFYNALIHNLDPFITDWSSICYVSKILRTAAPFHTKKAKSNDWTNIILKFISKFYKEASTKAKENINFTDFFEILKDLNVTDVSVLESEFKNIILSPANSSILTLLNPKQKEVIFSLFNNSNSYVSFVLKSALPDEEDEKSTKTNNFDFVVDSIFDHPPKNMKKSDILKSILSEIKSSDSSPSFTQFLIDNYSKLILPLFFDLNTDVRKGAENITYHLFDESNQSSSSSSSSDEENAIIPQRRISTKQEATKSFQNFSKKLSEIVNDAVNLIDKKYTNKVSLIINFLRIILWFSKQCDIFNSLLSIYQVVSKKNENENVPDSNFINSLSSITKYINSVKDISKYENDLVKIIYQLFRFGSCDDTSKPLFEIMALLSTDSLINIYKSKEFMTFFKKETKLKKSEELFKKCYNSKDTFERVIKNSEEVTKNLINFVIKESNLEADHMTITLIIKNRINLISDKLYLDSINYIVGCAIENADFDLFKQMIDIINKTFNDRVEDNFDFSGIEDRLVDSLVFLRGSNAKSKRFYSILVTNICTKSEKITDKILKKLIDILKTIIQDDESEFRYYILAFENIVVETNRFDYFNEFLEKVIPLKPVSFWDDADVNPYSIASKHYQQLSDSKKIAIKAILMQIKLSTKYIDIYNFVEQFIRNSSIDECKSIISDIGNTKEAENNEETENLQYNWRIISKIRPELKDVLIFSDDDSESDS